MNREDVIRMAREAGLTGLMEGGLVEYFERFAALVAAAENEACAKVCDSWSKRPDDVGGYCAAEIRARGKNEN